MVHRAARSNWASCVLLGDLEGLRVREGRAVQGEARRCSGGRDHGPQGLRRPAGPSGRVAPGLCIAPEIPSLGGKGAWPRAKPAGPPAVPGQGPQEGGGWREREEGGAFG